MGNEKSRNHDTKGGKGGASKHQGKPKDQDGSGAKTAEAKAGPGNRSQAGESKDKGAPGG